MEKPTHMDQRSLGLGAQPSYRLRLVSSGDDIGAAHVAAAADDEAEAIAFDDGDGSDNRFERRSRPVFI